MTPALPEKVAEVLLSGCAAKPLYNPDQAAVCGTSRSRSGPGEDRSMRTKAKRGKVKAKTNGRPPKREIVTREVELADLSVLRPDPHNARKHGVRNLGVITDSLREVGTGRSVLIDGKDTLIAGNGVRTAAQMAGVKKVMIVDADADTLVAVRRKDLKGRDRTRMALMDNRSGELAEWNPDVLKEIAEKESALLTGIFEGDELGKIIGEQEEREIEDAAIPEMELQPYEYYDYVVLMFRNQLDFLNALDRLGVGRVGFTVGDRKRKIGLGRVLDGPEVMAMFDGSGK